MTTALQQELPVLAGKYRLDSLLGEGGMGQVYRATNLLLGREVAIKILRKEFAVNPSSREKFIAEARAANTVRHPHVVDVLDVVADDVCPYIVQELLSGQTLADRLVTVERLSVADTLELMIPVAAALAHAHERGILHRDIKPENIFLTEHDGVVIPKLVDFGLSQLYRETQSEEASSVIAGTPAYMAPEVVHGDANVDPRSDVWSLGLVLYECTSGMLPFRSDTVREVLQEISTGVLRSLDEVSPGLPPSFVSVVQKCLQRELTERFANGRELLGALEDLRRSTGSADKSALKVRRKSTLAPGMIMASDVRAGIAAANAAGAGVAVPPMSADVSQPIAARPVHVSTRTAPREPISETMADLIATPAPVAAKSAPPGPISTLPISGNAPPAKPSRVAWVAAGLLALSGLGLVVARSRVAPHDSVTAEGAPTHSTTSAPTHLVPAASASAHSPQPTTPVAEPTVLGSATHEQPANSATNTVNAPAPSTPEMAPDAEAPLTATVNAHNSNIVSTRTVSQRVRRARPQPTSSTEAAPPIVLRLNR